MENAKDIERPFDKNVIYPARWEIIEDSILPTGKVIVVVGDKSILFDDTNSDNYVGLKQSIDGKTVTREKNGDKNNYWKHYERVSTDKDMEIPNVPFNQNKVYNALYLDSFVIVYIEDKTVILPKSFLPDHYLGLQIVTDVQNFYY
jgi:hypothetical protein